ncbi:hypothetical protein GOP47_0028636 [Adiantum capillus-veneris]|nr:hypothetical protein GOP47_0028636 [Adiantum capillus-veneris]
MCHESQPSELKRSSNPTQNETIQDTITSANKRSHPETDRQGDQHRQGDIRTDEQGATLDTKILRDCHKKSTLYHWAQLHPCKIGERHIGYQEARRKREEPNHSIIGHKVASTKKGMSTRTKAPSTPDKNRCREAQLANYKGSHVPSEVFVCNHRAFGARHQHQRLTSKATPKVECPLPSQREVGRANSLAFQKCRDRHRMAASPTLTPKRVAPLDPSP